MADPFVSQTLQKAEVAPLLIEVPDQHMESFAQALTRVWNATLIVADQDPQFRKRLADAVSDGLHVILVVRDPSLISSFIWCVQYVRPEENVHLPIHDGYVKASPDFRICCILKDGTSSWADEWRNRMRDHWLYDALRTESPGGDRSMVNLLMQIPRKAITAKDTLVFTKRLEKWQTEYAEHAKKAGIPITRFLRGTVLFSVEGYDSDPRELYEIPEVREWFRELLRKVPYLFYYVDPDPAHHQYSFIIPMYVKFTSVPGHGIQMNSDALLRFVETEAENVRLFAKRIGDDPNDAGIMFLDGLQGAWSF